MMANHIASSRPQLGSLRRMLVRLLQEEVIAVVNERTSKTLFVLTRVTVLALPMTIIPGLFGMNVGGVPFHDTSAGFWLVVTVVIGVAIVAGVIVFRRIEDA